MPSLVSFKHFKVPTLTIIIYFIKRLILDKILAIISFILQHVLCPRS